MSAGIKRVTGQRRRVEYRLKCACGFVTAWRIERKRIPSECAGQRNNRLVHHALVEKKVSWS